MDSLFAVKNKIIFVTGGSRGIGYMIASCYVKAGARVYITSRDQKRCAAVERELESVQISYTAGAMTIQAAMAETANAGGIAGNTYEENEIAVSFAF